MFRPEELCRHGLTDEVTVTSIMVTEFGLGRKKTYIYDCTEHDRPGEFVLVELIEKLKTH